MHAALLVQNKRCFRWLQWLPSLEREFAALGALRTLKQLFLEADMGDSRLRSLRLGASVMVTV